MDCGKYKVHHRRGKEMDCRENAEMTGKNYEATNRATPAGS
jgi:hypothetical protein